MEEQKERQALRALIAGVLPGRENALVFGEGPKNPKLMLIGEAPGEQESLMGRPFVGKAGKNLDHFLALVGLVRGEIYITNVVKFRPTKTGATGRLSNRPPTREEIALFRPWLMAEIARVNPGMIATLGNVPLRALTASRATIGERHGQFMQADGLEIYPMYHPASIIYNPSLREVYTADVRRLGQWLRENAANG